MFHRVLFDYGLLKVLRNMFLILSSITHMCLQEGKFWLMTNVVFLFFCFSLFTLSWDLQVQYCLYYVINQQTHVFKICFIVYYELTHFGHFCDHHQGVVQEYKQYVIQEYKQCIIVYCSYSCITHSWSGAHGSVVG